ncbi:MAG: phage head-tail connector protein [Sphingobium sp.]|nr:phage head-tail connector protein [Sphingobium sp.]
MTVTIENGGPLAAPLDALKAYLRISSTAEDDLLTDLLRAATDVAERFIGQLIIARGIEEMMEPSNAWRALAMRPVTAITAVAGVPASGPEFALGVDAYAVDIDGNGDGWLRVRDAGAAVQSFGRIHVSYRAGIAADADGVPDSIRLGIVRLAGDYHALREGVRAHPPASVTALWRPWRRMVLK